MPTTKKVKKRILLVEDDADIARSVAFRLRKQDYDVETVNDGKTALQIALQSIPDLVILDLMLPSLSGEEICKGIREHDDETIQKIPIIMLTAKSTEADGIVGRVIGANYYMAKPFYMEDLLREIEKLTRDVSSAG
jgi:DNA-binding response OmpR family regulator